MSRLSVRLVIDAENRQWIIGKIASRLAENLEKYDVTADIGDGPRDDADVIHWMHYLQPWRCYYPSPGFFNPGWSSGRARNTALITHVDDPVKLQAIKEAMSKILDVGICMSRMMKAELVAYGIDPSHLTYIHPGHDRQVQPRRIVIGITSRMYADGRKREDVLVKVAESMRLDAFKFEIIGEGWEEVANILRNAGAEVEIAGSADEPGSDHSGYARILRRLPHFDYYLYLGWDEGSMGTLDALAAGVKTIVTPQGFHLDLKSGITHAPRDAGDLIEIFQGIAAERQLRLASVQDLTWSEYARKHAAVWRALVDGHPAEITRASGEIELESRMERPILPLDLSAARSRLNRRLLRSDFWSSFFESRRFWTRGKLSRVKRWLLRRSSR
jgi:glycosyltransferase involved in cell wall biosynthesis